MMRIVGHAKVALNEAAPERDALDVAMTELAALFSGGGNVRTALFVASMDAGSRTALRFWSEAQRTGVALANPELFPWCLANAPCAAIARRFGITGPNGTWLGDDALAAAWSAAGTRLAKGTVEQVFVVSVDFGHAPGNPKLEAWRIDSGSGGVQSAAGPAAGSVAVPENIAD
jgi:hypothetical protein